MTSILRTRIYLHAHWSSHISISPPFPSLKTSFTIIYFINMKISFWMSQVGPVIFSCPCSQEVFNYTSTLVLVSNGPGIKCWLISDWRYRISARHDGMVRKRSMHKRNYINNLRWNVSLAAVRTNWRWSVWRVKRTVPGKHRVNLPILAVGGDGPSSSVSSSILSILDRLDANYLIS